MNSKVPGSNCPLISSKIEAEICWGDWPDAVRTQLKEFKPVYVIPSYDIV